MIAVALHNQVQVTTLTHDACVPWWQTRQESQDSYLSWYLRNLPQEDRGSEWKGFSSVLHQFLQVHLPLFDRIKYTYIRSKRRSSKFSRIT